MLRTEYSTLTNDELVEFVINRDTRTHLEVELAQRLDLALDMLRQGMFGTIEQCSKLNQLDDEEHIFDDPRRSS